MGKHDAFHPIAHETKKANKKLNQFANWTNIAAGIHSTTASEFRLFSQTNQVVATDY